MVREWCSDDGEPSGSAGKPALNVLEQRELRNMVVAVVRYYGGTNLGVGGLARAYSRAVKEAVDAAGVVEDVPHERFEAAVEYDDSGTVRGITQGRCGGFWNRRVSSSTPATRRLRSSTFASRSPRPTRSGSDCVTRRAGGSTSRPSETTYDSRRHSLSPTRTYPSPMTRVHVYTHGRHSGGESPV